MIIIGYELQTHHHLFIKTKNFLGGSRYIKTMIRSVLMTHDIDHQFSNTGIDAVFSLLHL